MSRYNVFDGGNELRHYDDFTSGVNGYDNIRPAAHHIDRTRHILFHVNTGDRPFTAEWNPLVVAHNDELVTHVLGAGWVITGVGIHIKQAGVGTIHPMIELGDASKVALASYDALTLPAALAPVYTDTAAIALNTVGYHWLRPVNVLDDDPVLITTREVLNPAGVGFLALQYQAPTPERGEDPAPLGGCFGVILEVTYLEDERACSCVTVPCPTEYPAPICSPQIGA